MTDRVFNNGVLLTETPSRGATLDAEATYWQHRAALLDPDAYEYVTGTGWARAVPVGACWWALNLWWVKTADGGYQFLRVADVAGAVPLAAGTVLRADATQVGFAYLCKPETVIDADPRYGADPKGLFFTRITALRSLPSKEISVKVAAGSPLGAAATTVWPVGVTRGMLLHASVHDAAWVTMTNPAGGINLLHEISDDHAMRLARGITVPFRTSDFTGLKIRAGAVHGDFVGETSMAGWGFARYVSLPDDW